VSQSLQAVQEETKLDSEAEVSPEENNSAGSGNPTEDQNAQETPSGENPEKKTFKRRKADIVIDNLVSQIGPLGNELADIAGILNDVNDRSKKDVDGFDRLEAVADAVRTSNVLIQEASVEAKENSDVAQKDVEESQTALQTALEEMKELSMSVRMVESQLEELQSSLENVGTVASSIDAIARQTNLLALNATIEAARAGEAGKGFAVVANEVKALAAQTSQATGEIDSTLQELTKGAEQLIENGHATIERADNVEKNTHTLTNVIQNVSDAMQGIKQTTDRINEGVQDIDESSSEFMSTLGVIGQNLRQTNTALNASSDRLLSAADRGDKLASTAAQGLNTSDTKMMNLVIERANQIAEKFEAELESGTINMIDLFDRDLKEIPGSNPIQYMTKYIDVTDRVVTPIIDQLVEEDERIVFSCPGTEGGFVPTHNSKISKPQGDDPEWNAANCRNRRLFDDRTGVRAAENTEPFLLQSYRRDMGGGNHVVMKDISAPIIVRGKHWGGLRLGYKPE